MAYEDILREYQRNIQSEQERLKKAQSDLFEEIAADFASRGLLGGRAHIAQIISVQKAYDDSIANLKKDYANLYAQVMRDKIAQEERKEERKSAAKSARRSRYLQTGIQLLTTPWKYSPEGIPQKTLGGVIWDWVRNKMKKAKGNEKISTFIAPKIELIPKDKRAYLYRPFVGKSTLSNLANKWMSFNRPKLPKL